MPVAWGYRAGYAASRVVCRLSDGENERPLRLQRGNREQVVPVPARLDAAAAGGPPRRCCGRQWSGWTSRPSRLTWRWSRGPWPGCGRPAGQVTLWPYATSQEATSEREWTCYATSTWRTSSW